MPNAKDFVLIVTVGTSDIQVVYGWPNDPRRLRLRRGCERAFHEACRAGRFHVEMLSFDQTSRCQPHYKAEFIFDKQNLRLSTALTEEDEELLEIDCSEGVVLCAPLLADLWRALNKMQERGELGGAQGVLLLNTARDAGRFRDQEPVAVLELVRPVLADAFDVREDQVQQCAYLVGDEELYEEDRYGQRHLRVSAAKRIDDSVCDLHRRFPDAVAVVSHVGGIPEVKAVLAASCRYRFGDQVRFVAVGEGGTTAYRKVVVPPAQSLTDRMQIRRLVRSGAFDAAAKLACAAPSNLQKTEPWRIWLNYAARWIGGDRSVLDKRQEEIPDESRIGQELRRMNDPALVLAFRIEGQLRRRDWVGALVGTVTFKELCGGRIKKLRGAEDRLERAKHAMNELSGKVDCIAQYRNRAVHYYRLTSAQLREAREKAMSSGLWSAKRPHFLGGTVGEVLAAMGNENAANKYDELVEAILADMDAFSFRE